MNTPSPTVKRRRLAAELRRLREAAGLTGEQVAEYLECSGTRISRIEKAQVNVGARDVRDMAELYGVGEQDREALMELARSARKRGWWRNFEDALPGWFQAFVGLEAAASTIRNYEGQCVPGLLQTEDYMRAMLSAARVSDADEVEQRVALRTARQKELLNRAEPPRLWVVLDEAVLHRQVGGPEVMRAQLHRLAEAGQWLKATVQVLPFERGAHCGMDGPFILLEYPDRADRPIVYVEGRTNSLYLELPDEVTKYRMDFDHLSAAALSPEDSRKRILAAAERPSQPA